MKKIIYAVITLLATLGATSASATSTWIVLGDSIITTIPQGTASQSVLNLISNERDVLFKSIASPGQSMGMTDVTGYNTDDVIKEMQRIGGLYSYFDGIMIQALTNDYGRNIPPDKTIASLRRVMAFARAIHKKVFAIDPIWRAGESNPNTVGYTLTQYRDYMAYICEWEYPDVCHFAHRQHTIMGDWYGYQNYDAAEVAAGVQTHPNPAGQRLMANWIEAEAAAAGLF